MGAVVGADIPDTVRPGLERNAEPIAFPAENLDLFSELQAADTVIIGSGTAPNNQGFNRAIAGPRLRRRRRSRGRGASVDGIVTAYVVVSAADAAEDASPSDLDWHPASGVDNRSAQNRAMAARAVFFI